MGLVGQRVGCRQVCSRMLESWFSKEVMG